jgi:hypothetical protein
MYFSQLEKARCSFPNLPQDSMFALGQHMPSIIRRFPAESGIAQPMQQSQSVL